MPKRMNGNKLNSIKMYRKELLNKKGELLTSLGFNFKRLADAERNSEDDLIVALHDEFLHLGLDRVIYGQLQEVESALNRLGSGEYGAYANCGDSISAKRLQAVPWATNCIACQNMVFASQPQETVSLETSLTG
jgi:RNA polymerase-binding transcription factor